MRGQVLEAGGEEEGALQWLEAVVRSGAEGVLHLQVQHYAGLCNSSLRGTFSWLINP